MIMKVNESYQYIKSKDKQISFHFGHYFWVKKFLKIPFSQVRFEFQICFLAKCSYHPKHTSHHPLLSNSSCSNTWFTIYRLRSYSLWQHAAVILICNSNQDQLCMFCWSFQHPSIQKVFSLFYRWKKLCLRFFFKSFMISALRRTVMENNWCGKVLEVWSQCDAAGFSFHVSLLSVLYQTRFPLAW